MKFSYYYYILNFLCLFCFLNAEASEVRNEAYFSTSGSFDDLKNRITSSDKTEILESTVKPSINIKANSESEDQVKAKRELRIKRELYNGITLLDKRDFSKEMQAKVVNKRSEKERKLTNENVPAFQTSSSKSPVDLFKDLIGISNTTPITKTLSMAVNPHKGSTFNFKHNDINFNNGFEEDTTDEDLTPEDRYPNYVQNKDKTVHVGTNPDLEKHLYTKLLKGDSVLAETEWHGKMNEQDSTKHNTDDIFTTVKAKQEIIRNPKGSNVTLLLKVHGGESFKAYLDVLKNETFMPNAQVTIHDNENMRNISISSLKDLYMYEGSLDSKNTSYACGSIVDSYFVGVLMLGNGTVGYMERPENNDKIKKSTNSSDTYISFKKYANTYDLKNDVKFSGCKRTKEKIACFEGSLEQKEKSNSTSRESLSDHTSRPHSPSNFLKNASCSIEVASDPTHFVKVHNQSVSEALREILTVVMQANQVFNQVDFDGDGRPENLSLRIGHAAMYASYKDETLNDEERVMDQKLNAFLKHAQNGCLSLLFLSDNLKSEEPVSITYGGGVCQNSRNKTHPPTNVAVINVIGPKNRTRSLLPMSLRVTETIGEMMGGMEEECEGMNSSEDDWHSYFPECSQRSMAETLSKQGFCLETHQDNHTQELRVGRDTAGGSQCGNGILDSGEECDCGIDCQKNYSCCVPKGKENECKYDKSKGHECEWSDLCCTMSCRFIPKEWKKFCGSGVPSCGPKDAYCNGSSSACPDHQLDPRSSDGHRCGPGNFEQVGAGTCKEGRCDSTVCRDAGLEDCRCEHQSHKKCKVCCKKKGKDEKCQLWKDFGLKSNLTSFFYRYPGLPCSNENNKYCDAKGACTSKLSGGNNAEIFYSKMIGKRMSAAALVAWTVLWRVMCIRLV